MATGGPLGSSFWTPCPHSGLHCCLLHVDFVLTEGEDGHSTPLSVCITRHTVSAQEPGRRWGWGGWRLGAPVADGRGAREVRLDCCHGARPALLPALLAAPPLAWLGAGVPPLCFPVLVS